MFFVEGNAAGIGVGDTGIDIDDILTFQTVLQCLIEKGASAGAPCVLRHIDRGLHSPVIGSPFLKFGCIGIPQDASIPDSGQIGVPLQGGGDAVFKFPDRGDLIFKGNGGFST